ncbi:MAG: hypothetical protein Q8R49_02285, partial [Rhodoferax sp.]|nr:hypothetical protein [Rhodoferax sp.]
VHLPEQPQFTLAVQWHPEWQAAQNPFSARIFQAFGQACSARQSAGLPVSEHAPRRAVGSIL